MSCVPVYYDLLSSIPPCPSFYMLTGVGFTWKIRVGYNLPDQDSISTYLFNKIYLLNSSGCGPPGPDL
jgi:hypothetical protein